MSTREWFGLADVLVEGATDHYCGRPRNENPYDPVGAADAFAAWLWGWDEAKEQLELRGRAETARWLTEAG